MGPDDLHACASRSSSSSSSCSPWFQRTPSLWSNEPRTVALCLGPVNDLEGQPLLQTSGPRSPTWTATGFAGQKAAAPQAAAVENVSVFYDPISRQIHHHFLILFFSMFLLLVTCQIQFIDCPSCVLSRACFCLSQHVLL